jgi:hypothetical protein
MRSFCLGFFFLEIALEFNISLLLSTPKQYLKSLFGCLSPRCEHLQQSMHRPPFDNKETTKTRSSQEKLLLPLHENQCHVHQKALLTRPHLDAHTQKRARALLDILFQTVLSKKSIANLVPCKELLKIFRRTRKME